MVEFDFAECGHSGKRKKKCVFTLTCMFLHLVLCCYTNLKHISVNLYSLCMKSQVVDLQAEGYSPTFMDEFQPDIVVSDW